MDRNHVIVLSNYSNLIVSSRDTLGQGTIHTTTASGSYRRVSSHPYNFLYLVMLSTVDLYQLPALSLQCHHTVGQRLIYPKREVICALILMDQSPS